MAPKSKPLGPSTATRASVRMKFVAAKQSGSKRKQSDTIPQVIESDDENSVDKQPQGDTQSQKKVKLERHTRFDREKVQALLEKVKMTEAVKTATDRMLDYPLREGRYYPEQWYVSKPALAFFCDVVHAQGWESALGYVGPIYPCELIQFWGTVKFEEDYLVARVNGKLISISEEEFSTLFHAPYNDALPSIYYIGDWLDMSEDEKVEIRQMFDPNASADTPNVGNVLEAKARFLFIVVKKTLLPRKEKRGHVAISELLLMSKLLKKERVNMASFVFAHINHTAQDLMAGSKQDLCVPYGMWISKVLMEKGAIRGESVVIESTDEMKDGVLGQMSLAIKGNILVTKSRTDDGKTAAASTSKEAGTDNAGGSSDVQKMVMTLGSQLSDLKADIALALSDADVQEAHQAVVGLANVVDNVSNSTTTLHNLVAELRHDMTVVTNNLLTIDARLLQVGNTAARAVRYSEQCLEILQRMDAANNP